MNILLTSIGGGLGIQRVLNFKKIKLNKKNLNVIGIDNNKNSLSRYYCNKFYSVNKGTSKEYINDLIKIVKLENINLIIPGSDEEALKLSQNYIVFKNIGCSIEVSNINALKIISNKAKTYELLQKYNLGNPNWKKASTKKELKNQINYFFDNRINEIIIKPSISRGSRDIFCISNNAKSEKNFLFPVYDYKKFSINIDNIFKSRSAVIMEKYNSDIYDCDVHCNNGKLINLTLRQRLNKFLPNEGHIILNADKVKTLVSKVSKILKLSSVHDFDLMIDKKGNYKIIEINPRMSGSICTSVLAGASYYKDIILLSKNKKILARKAMKNKIIVPSLNLSIFSK